MMASASKKSPSSSSKKREQAADLIRNLDAALLEMTNSAAKSADDAARARRNARTAGEVARRYGKTNKSSAEKSLLEKKREKRAATRLAAEAKQRRDHPRSSPVRKVVSPSSNSYRFVPDNHNFNQFEDLTAHQREDGVQQSNVPEQFSSGMSRYNDDAPRRDEQMEREKSSTKQPIMEEQPYQTSSNQHEQEDDDNIEYYSQNMESYYDDQQNQQHLHHQPPPTAAEMESMNQNKSPTRNPPVSPRKQPTTSARIQASHAEDVLTLSLELERTRSALKAANAQLVDVQSQNEELQSQLLQNNDHERQQSTQSSSQLMEELRMEKVRSKAAEEDAALALELAKDAQAVKEECEEWLTMSLDEIEFWKNKCLSMEKELGKQQQQQSLEEAGDDDIKRLVHFKEDCPPSPVVSLEGGDATAVDESEKRPPPPQYPIHPSPKDDTWSTPQTTGSRRLTSTPNSAPTPSSKSKSAVAHGRLFLHNASPLLSPTGELSPHPSIRATELMRRSAETRRILRERLSSSGRLDSSGPSPPPSMVHIAAVSAATKGGDAMSNDASHQGAALYKTVANVLYESGHRLKLDGKKWTRLTQDGSHVVVVATATGLESMVQDYCGQVEGKIGQQAEKINELSAFCDHLEVEYINLRKDIRT